MDYDILFNVLVKLGRKGKAGNQTHNLMVYLLAGEHLNHPGTVLLEVDFNNTRVLL